MKIWLLCLFTCLAFCSDEALSEHQQSLIKEKMRIDPNVAPLKDTALRITRQFKTKYNAKGASSRKHALPEENLYDAKEIHIPTGIEFAENFTGSCAFGSFLKFLSELKFTEKIVSNKFDPNSVPKLSNTAKCKLGLNLSPWDFFEIESFLEEKITKTYVINGRDVKYKPTKADLEGIRFDQCVIKFKFKY